MIETHAPRRIALGTLVVMLAILLAGLGTMPAHAADNRQPQVDRANQYIGECVGGGGEPEVDSEEEYGWTSVACEYDDHYEYCYFYYDGTTSCGRGEYEITQPLPGFWDLSPIVANPVIVADPMTVADPVIDRPNE